METLTIGLLFIIICLSVFICVLIRVVVELINGSNRKHHKSHVSIMCSAFCGSYRNTDGDFRAVAGAGGGGRVDGDEAGHHFHHHYQQQQRDHTQPPQSHFRQHQQQYNQHNQPQQQSVPGHHLSQSHPHPPSQPIGHRNRNSDRDRDRERQEGGRERDDRVPAQRH